MNFYWNRGRGFGATLDDHVDLAGLMEPVALRLLGEPNREKSTRDQLRFGTHGSLAVEVGGRKAGTWYDHERGEGGGVLDLVRREANVGHTKGEAFKWLESEGFVEGDTGEPPRQADPPPKPRQRRVVAE